MYIYTYIHTLDNIVRNYLFAFNNNWECNVSQWLFSLYTHGDGSAP